MANTIIIKNSAVVNREPALADLQYGEIAINYADGKIFYKTVADEVNYFASRTISGTVKSVDVSGGTTGMNFTGGPITDSGTLTLDGTLAIANGGTGATTASDAINNLLPDQTDAEGLILTSVGGQAQWNNITWDNIQNKPAFSNVAFSGLLSDLGDIDLSVAPQEGQVLGYDSAIQKWKPITVVGLLSELNDVEIGTPNQGNVLVYVNALEKWVSTDTLSNITIDAGLYNQ